MADTRWLEKRRQTWFCVVEVPPSLRLKLGRRIRRTLKTRDLRVAQARRFNVIGEIKRMIDDARRDRDGDPVMQEALGWRETLEAARDGAAVVYGLDKGETPEQFIRDRIEERADELASRRETEASAKTFSGIATGRATPLGLYVETWLAEGGTRGGQLKERTKLERRSAVTKLGEWLPRVRLPVAVEAITRRVAGRYVSEELIPSGRDPVTLGKSVRTLASYWTWLIRRGHLPEETRNPWDGQAPRQGRNGAAEERAFTDEEIARLLASPPDQTLGDFMLVAALTGMRREEIGMLRVADCTGGVFIVQQGKTAAARRRVPIHSALSAMIERRTASKAPTAYVFNELRSRALDRTDPIGKQFTRYRRSLGMQEGDGRRSLVNFHSFRRWFTTAAINAGQPPHIVSLVVGHTEGRKGMTLGRYWQGGDDAALRACVEAVKLPEGRARDVP